MTESAPVFALEPKADASGQGVTLKVMPRTFFLGLGYQMGLRLVTTKDGESVYEQTAGMSDAEARAVALALLAQIPAS